MEDGCMGRHARKSGESNIYHVMLRGINRQEIFEDREDEDKFLTLLDEYKLRCGFAVYGYCLMNNHVHLLLHGARNPCICRIGDTEVELGPGESLSQAIKRLGVSYVMFFNRKYARTGHLFQDRFKSEPIDGDPYFLMALRYIHRNPIKAGICAQPEAYYASSYREYIGASPVLHTDVDFALSILSREELIAYTNEDTSDCFIDIPEKVRHKSDAEIKDYLVKQHNITSAAAFQALDRPTRNRLLQEMYARGAAITQISRITGCSRTIIYRTIKTKKE